jgi:DNA helicase II / ATP-dependent DNA helicase PcrA
MNDSTYQLAIYADIANPDAGNLLVEAVAGSGKTTTLTRAVKHILAGLTHIMLAFNKSIATELSARGVNARTFHSLCYSPVTRARGVRTVDGDKLRGVVDANMGDDDARMYGAFCCKLVGLARQSGVGCLVDDEPGVWADLAALHDMDLDNERADFDTAIDFARKLLAWSNDAAAVDFDDLLYLAVKDGITLPKFDMIFIDEAQDTNAIQRAIVRKIMKPGARIVAVGDPAQAIYGFRGADSNSLNMIAEEFGCKRLPLTVSYRCPTSVVEFAQKFVTHIEAAPDAPAGSVVNVNTLWNERDFKANDLIVCRTTKPLVTLAFTLIRARVPARIMGREIGNGLKSLINKMNGKGIDGLIAKLNAWTLREVEKAIAKGQDSKAEAISDKTDTVMFLIESLTENGRTVPALLALIDSLFADTANAVVLATIHKAKGLEADRVYWLNSSQCPSKWARQDWQKQQERNLCYVAITRARRELVLIEEKKKS